MKVLVVAGTRPEFIRLSRVVALLGQEFEVVLVNTGQSYDYTLSGIFFHELGYEPGPKYNLSATGTVAEQLAKIFTGMEDVLCVERPDRVLILGDTNSSLSAIIAKRMDYPIFHMEAGNRCFDKESPEEINRRIIDHVSTIHLPYTEASRHNLLREGIDPATIFVTGNPIWEVLQYYAMQEEDWPGVEPDEPFFIVTAHRQENVDNPLRLRSIIESLIAISKEYPDHKIIVSTHPRTAKRIAESDMAKKWVHKATDSGISFRDTDSRIIFHHPMGFREFVRLEAQASCVITDSGTCQEEACILGTPCVTIRNSTERPETVEGNANVVVGVEPENVLRGVRLMMGRNVHAGHYAVPREYVAPHVSEVVANILAGYYL